MKKNKNAYKIFNPPYMQLSIILRAFKILLIKFMLIIMAKSLLVRFISIQMQQLTIYLLFTCLIKGIQKNTLMHWIMNGEMASFRWGRFWLKVCSTWSLYLNNFFHSYPLRWPKWFWCQPQPKVSFWFLRLE